jgi:23S rRNA (cytidine1920-2'-O)/16S rRNA (cytidine1409-2'-O)-methyltransferase
MDLVRLDLALVQRGIFASRERAQVAIESGLVHVNGQVARKAALKVGPDSQLSAAGDPIGFVGRGGLKLEGALDHFGIAPFDQICLDVGASTGGFTDCLLQRGARRVYAVDVGKDQIHPDLRHHPRVVVMEQTDIRTIAALPERPLLAAIDVSFISLTMVLPKVTELLDEDGMIIALIKPQFELTRTQLSKRGIVKDPKLRVAAVQRVLSSVQALRLHASAVIPSPILGSEGNQEYLVQLRRT